jgi:transposase-like protein
VSNPVNERFDGVYPNRVVAKFCPVCGEAKPEPLGSHRRSVVRWWWRCTECQSVFLTTTEGDETARPRLVKGKR